MKRRGNSGGARRAFPALLAVAAMIVAVPGVGLAVGSPVRTGAAPAALAGLPFTPANVDPGLALKVARVLGGEGLRFTPASRTARGRDRTVTVAVRVDEATARAISIRKTLESGNDDNRIDTLAIAPSRYNLGIARGYQSFVQPSKAPAVSEGLRELPMPDLSSYRPEGDGKSSRAGRFQSRLALEQAARTGRSEGSYAALGEQSVDLRGSYRVTGNLDLTAGVRLTQERDRLAPLTDGVDDDKSVYVGTQIKF